LRVAHVNWTPGFLPARPLLMGFGFIRSNREAARQRDIYPAIPYRSNAKGKPAFFSKTALQGPRPHRPGGRQAQARFQRIALRCEKTAQNYGYRGLR
jgi:hypothetical protein